jgi:hypothetical protein
MGSWVGSHIVFGRFGEDKSILPCKRSKPVSSFVKSVALSLHKLRKSGSSGASVISMAQHRYNYRMAHEKPARRLVDQRGRRS